MMACKQTNVPGWIGHEVWVENEAVDTRRIRSATGKRAKESAYLSPGLERMLAQVPPARMIKAKGRSLESFAPLKNSSWKVEGKGG